MSHITLYEAAILGPFYAFVVMTIFYPAQTFLSDWEYRRKNDVLLILSMIVATLVVWQVVNFYRGDIPFDEGIAYQPASD